MFIRKIPIAFVWALFGVLIFATPALADVDFVNATAHTINNPGGIELTYYQIPFVLSNATGTNSGGTIYTNGDTQPDWCDIRFTNATGKEVFPHWIEATTATTATVWVNVTSIPVDGTTVRIYYGSDTATQTSNGTATFPHFDDFTGTALDTATRWTVATSQPHAVANGVITVTGASRSGDYIRSQSVWGQNYALKTRSAWGGVAATSFFGFYVPIAGTEYLASWSIAGMRSTSFDGAMVKDGQTIDTNWHTFEFIRNGTASVIINIDGTTTLADTTQILDDTLPIVFRQYASGTTQRHDWVLIRKYVGIEPTHGEYAAAGDSPEAAFSATPLSGTRPLEVAFTDESTNSPTSWNWSFGDGTYATTQNPIHTYTNAGNYTVALTATNSFGGNISTKADYITVIVPSPVTDFTANQTSGYAPITVQFTDHSTNTPTSYTWDFGDGATSNEQNPSHTFTTVGSYSIVLTTANAIGSDDETKNDYITALPQPPVAGFSADVIAGHSPLTVQFTDTSTGSPTSWAWDFDGDLVADSIFQNPTYEYTINGTYSVSHQAWNDGGTDVETKTDLIYVGALTAKALTASFRYTIPQGTAPLSVTFTDTTKANGTYARLWEFGDGATSAEKNPIHEYATAGKYDVQLSVQSDHTSDVQKSRKAIMAYPSAAGSPIPTTTFGAHMTEIMESNWNVSVIGPIIPMAYTDALTPLAGGGAGDLLFWGIVWAGVFMILFLRQGTPWLALLVGMIAGPGIIQFLPPEFAHIGYICMAVTAGGFFAVFILGRFRST